jgi:BirA family biotin operon repressor/biotin-[acetyl-CoA-carboxylase] ligase
MNLDISILKALRQSSSRGVSGAELSQTLGVSRTAIWARIEELRKLGYDISASPHLGYKLLSVPDVLHADDLLSRRNGKQVVGREIHVFQSTTSTNDLIERMARDGAREGVAVFAETQTHGRGRMGRKWVSPSGKGLWFSVLLRPSLTPSATMQITVGAAVALRRAIRSQTSLAPEIKWPNDILIGNKKTAGILTELRAEPDRIKYVILGIGIDVNISRFPSELERIATSLSIELGHPVHRADLADAVLRELDDVYRAICDEDFKAIAQEWEQNCSTIGCEVQIRQGDRVISGVAESLDVDGALRIRSQHGHLERVLGGDVTVEKR